MAKRNSTVIESIPSSNENSSGGAYDFGVKPTSKESLKIDATIAYHKDQFEIRQNLRKSKEKIVTIITVIFIALVVAVFLSAQT